MDAVHLTFPELPVGVPFIMDVASVLTQNLNTYKVNKNAPQSIFGRLMSETYRRERRLGAANGGSHKCFQKHPEVVVVMKIPLDANT